MPGCCSCVSAFKPRWKRLVDNIFPDDPQDGLIKNNMEKLTFYALSSPEKLDRIGVYLAKKLSRDVSRHKHEYVFISMAALDQLLLACHAQSVNLFVESFLKMVQKLLESNEPELQVQGTQSFVKFANIEEDTPSYHRRYDFFVSKFSSMCHYSNRNETWKTRLRLAGLRGLQGVVRKTVTDDLQVNIWEQQHMDKIVPSLLFNMHEGPSSSTSSQQDHQNLAKQSDDDGEPSAVAETCLRDLTCRAAFGNIKSVLKPVLTHLDLHNLWVPSTFAVRCFKIIMYSIQAQYSYVAVHMLLNHLDENTKNSPEIKQSIVEVLAECVAISADGSIGPSVLEVFNTLLRHLRLSVDARLSQRRASKAPLKRTSYLDEEQHTRFEEAIINTIGTFATILPDYQKIEIMMFIMGKVPLPTQYEHSDEDSYPIPRVNGEGDLLLQNMMLKSLLEVGTKYTTVSMATTFPVSFLEPLLAISVVADAGVRVLVQDIFHTLFDRHENVEKLKFTTKDISQLDLRVEKSSRQDILFMKKNGGQITWHLYENMRLANNQHENFEAIYRTLALLCIELGGDEVLVELVRLTLAFQELACRADSKLSIPHQCAIHAVVASYLNLVSQLTAIPSFCQHTQQIIEERKKHAPYLLPDVVFAETTTEESYPGNLQVEDSLLFQQAVISEVLHSTGHDISRLNTPYVHRPSGIEYRQQTDADAASVNIEIESVSSSPSGIRKHAEEQITFESLKRTLQSPISEQDQQELEREKRQEILEHFKSSTLDEIAAVSEQRTQKLHIRLNEILDKISRPRSTTPPCSPKVHSPSSPLSPPVQSVPLYEMTFPELLVY